ncbi:DUF6049 family protein [Agromyces bracchium]|uniref:2-oxoglutarate dehydrogenase n=1 Tax=Agromyces bracchium TaxID=88376 RepID=A0A6I3M9M3_9MICO|nr:DUF6049 family protein [Agromyces bracchium]MTH68056.1 hypothetical protein [Agromyces bracchium]
MPAESTPPRRLRRLLALLFAGAATVALGVAGAVAPLDGPTGAPAARAAEPESGVSVSVAPADGTAVAAGAPIDVVVEIVNGGDAEVAAGTLSLGVAASGLDDVGDLDAWASDGGLPASARTVFERATAALPVGAVTTLEFTLPASATGAADPAVGLAASLESGGADVAWGTTAVANALVTDEDRPGLALVYPLTVPVNEGGMLPAERLESWTGPTGLLTRQLEAVSGTGVAIGIDPRIPVSIRALGSSAPESAVAWLEALAEMPNEVFPLAYADADIAAQSQAGLDAPLEPLGFADVVDAADFADAQGPAGATNAPGEAPTDAELLDWDFTRTDLAWPADDTVASGDLDRFAAGGLTTAILAPGNVEMTDGASNAAATIDGRGAVVADARLQAPLRLAAAAQTDAEWRSATSRLLAELALGPGDASATLLGSFARSAGADAERVGETLAALDGSQWSRTATLTEAVGAPPVSRTLVSLPEDAQRLENVDRLLGAESAVDEFSDVLDDPTLLTAPTRRDLLELLAVGWLDLPTEWTEAVGRWLVDQRAITDSVSVVPTSSVLVVASETGIPITIENDLPFAVNVVVTVDPSNGRLLVEDTVEATVEGESRRTVQVPVAAGVGSGEVDLEVSLTSPGGTPLGSVVRIPANVHADWEGVGATILAVLAVVVFGAGILRTILRRRRQRAAAGEATDAASEASPDDAGSNGDADAATRPEDPSNG